MQRLAAPLAPSRVQLSGAEQIDLRVRKLKFLLQRHLLQVQSRDPSVHHLLYKR